MASVLAGTGCSKRTSLQARDGGVPIDPRNDGGASIEVGATVDGAAGGVDGGDAGPGPGAACTPESGPPPAPLRRLSSFAYANTLRDVLGISLPAGAGPPAADPWDDGPATLGALTDAFHDVAHDFALASTRDAASVDALTGCDAGALGEATCAQRFVAAFIPRLFRRPLEAEDAADFAAVFAKGRELGGSYGSGVRAVVEVALQSPEFLYLVELGEPLAPPQAGVWRPRPHEMAARLSYFLLGSAPDVALTEAAAQDRLKTKDEIGAQARRLLADPRAHEVTGEFYGRLLRIGDLEGRRSIGPATARSASEETARFVDHVVWTEGGNLETLLAAPFTFVDETLAQLYGIPAVTGPAFRRVTLPPQQRRGVLTQVSVLASRSVTAPDVTHPSERGALIFEQLLCGDLTETPAPEQHPKPPRDAGETSQQWLARVTAPATCRSCHEKVDPLGLAFEHYAHYGAWRDADGGLPVDARGAITGIDTAGSVDGALALIGRLAASRDVQSCHVRKWMETAYGRPLAGADACARAELGRLFADSGGNIRVLMVGLTQTEAFLSRPAP